MANLIIKSSADNLVLQGSDASPAITVGATGTTTFAEATTFTGNVTLSGTANSLGNGFTHIETLVASGSPSTMHIEDCFTSTYNNYLLQISSYIPSSDGTDNKILFSTGGTVNTGSYYWYTWAGVKTSDGSDYRIMAKDQAFIYMTPNTGGNEDGANGTWFIHGPQNSEYCQGNGVLGSHHSSEYFVGGGHSFGWRGTTVFNGIQLAPNGGTIVNGAKMTVYGINGS